MPADRKPLNFDRPLRGRIYDSIAETIGNTPLVRVPRIAAEDGIVADLCLKLEFFNPIASVKDRIGVSMIDALEKAGKITAGKTTLVEPTSGNTGIALAFVAAARGYKLKLVMPETMSIERRKMLALLGAVSQFERALIRERQAQGIAKAKELVYTARMLPAQEAFEWGLINRVVADADLEKEAMTMASELANKATFAIALAKKMFQGMYVPTLETHLEQENLCQYTVKLTEDHAEGIAAFKEKRTAKFKGY